MLVPAIDADGNERDGVRLPEISVPLASYLSWNLRDPAVASCGLRNPGIAGGLYFSNGMRVPSATFG